MLKPLEDRVIVKFLELEESTKSGIFLPANAKEKSGIAEIISVGPGIKNGENKVEMILKMGDKVVCSKYAGTEIKYENEEYIILKQSDVLAIVD